MKNRICPLSDSKRSMNLLPQSSHNKFMLSFGVIIVLFSGCATTNRTKTLIAMGGVGATSAAVAYPMSPSSTDPAMHAVFWGGIGAAVAGAVGLFIFDEQKVSQEVMRKNVALKKEIDAYRTEARLDEEGTSVEGIPKFAKDLPDEVKGMIDPGKWKYVRFPKNKWNQSGKNSLLRVCEAFQMIPPHLKGSPSKVEQPNSASEPHRDDIARQSMNSTDELLKEVPRVESLTSQ